MNENNGKKNLFDVVNDFDVAMLVTHAPHAIHARPMAIAQLDYGLGIYLITDINSIKVDEIATNQHALLTFQSARRFASVSGVVEVLLDPQLITEVWKESWKVWFPGGKTDPNIALLKFTAHEGEFWDNAGMQGLKYVYEAAKAYVTGETPEMDEAQHDKVHL
jgi:general stress protein 26